VNVEQKRLAVRLFNCRELAGRPAVVDGDAGRPLGVFCEQGGLPETVPLAQLGEEPYPHGGHGDGPFQDEKHLVAVVPLPKHRGARRENLTMVVTTTMTMTMTSIAYD
jgi:hypothetical protein